MLPVVRTPHSHILKAVNDSNMGKKQVLEKGHSGQLADVRQGEAIGAQVQGFCGVGTKGNTGLEI